MIGLTLVVFDIFLNSVVSLFMVSMVFVLWELDLFKGMSMGFRNKIMLHCYRKVKYQHIQVHNILGWSYLTNASGLMVNTLEFDFGGWRLFTGRVGSIFAFRFWCCELFLKNHWGRERRPNFIIFVVWSTLLPLGVWWRYGAKVLL